MYVLQTSHLTVAYVRVSYLMSHLTVAHVGNLQRRPHVVLDAAVLPQTVVAVVGVALVAAHHLLAVSYTHLTLPTRSTV